MFQPLATPYGASFNAYGVANAVLPDYSFAPTPLGQGGGSGANSCSTSANNPGAANANVNVYASAAFHSPHPHSHPPLYTNSAPNNIKMEHGIAEQEAAARDWKPDLDGPLVSDKTSSHVITEEYAKADPVYVAKTLALPQTYSHYRPILGDGNCGWRAIGFGYLECLIRTGDVTAVQAELARMMSFNDYIASVGGYDFTIFEDMVEETFQVMRDIVDAMSTGQDAMEILISKFNDKMISAPIMYHLRLLAASWLKGNLDEFGSFVVGDVDDYCNEWILPVDKEMDHISLALLFNALVKPANIVLEVVYLDLSEGNHANVHRMPEEAEGQDSSMLGSVIHLLYRPGHYDILYRDPVPPLPPAPVGTVDLQVNRVTGFTHHHQIQSSVTSLGDYATLDMSALAMIPGLGGPALSPLSPPPAPSPLTADGYSPSPPSPWISQVPPPFADGLPAIPAAPQQPSPSQQQQQQSVPPLAIPLLRFSKYNYSIPGDADSSTYSAEPTFTTPTFKHSHFNTAHYNNPHFQPEEYKPGYDDEIPMGSSKTGGRKRSSEHCGGNKKGV